MEVLMIILIYALTSIFLVIFIRKGMRAQKQQLIEDEVVFTELFETSNQGLIIVNTSGKLLFNNEKANVIMDNNIKDKFDVDGNIIGKLVDEDIITCESIKKDPKYLNYHKRDFVYLGQEAYIYYLMDITEDYISINSFKEQAFNDTLTGLANRRKLNADYKNWKKDVESGGLSCVALIDIDHFKRINDNFGHDIGDDILKLFSNSFTQRLRSSDSVYRYGGEEFVLYLSGVEIQSAIKIIDEIKKEFSLRSNELLGYPATFSAGLVSFSEKCSSLSKTLSTCDKLLYKAKENGRNQTMV